MKTKIVLASLLTAALLAGGGTFLYRAGKHAGMTGTSGAEAPAPAAGDKKPLY